MAEPEKIEVAVKTGPPKIIVSGSDVEIKVDPPFVVERKK